MDAAALEARIAKLEQSVTTLCERDGHNYQQCQGHILQTIVYCTKCGDAKRLGESLDARERSIGFKADGS